MASHVDLVFNVAIDPATFTTADVTVTTPSGAIPAAQLTVSNTGGTQWRIGFPSQTANGHYQYQVGPHIANLFGAEMAAAYTGSFDISQTNWPGTMQFSMTGASAACAMSIAGRDELSTAVLHEPGELAGGWRGAVRRWDDVDLESVHPGRGRLLPDSGQ